MKPLRFSLLMGAAIMVAGCIPSLQPLFTDKTTVFEPALIGVWQQENGESTWAFARKESNIYSLTYTDNEGRPGQFEARLIKLGDKYFLDLFPDEPQQSENAYYKFHLLRVHTFLKVSLDGSNLQLAGMDPNWLKRQLDVNRSAVRHETVNNMIVLTATPAELQKFVRLHADDKDAFSAVIDLTRKDTVVAAAGT